MPLRHFYKQLLLSSRTGAPMPLGQGAVRILLTESGVPVRWAGQTGGDIVRIGAAEVALAREALNNPHWLLHATRTLSEDKTYDAWPPNMGWWLEVRQRMLTSTDPKDWRIGPAAANAPDAAAR